MAFLLLFMMDFHIIRLFNLWYQFIPYLRLLALLICFYFRLGLFRISLFHKRLLWINWFSWESYFTWTDQILNNKSFLIIAEMISDLFGSLLWILYLFNWINVWCFWSFFFYFIHFCFLNGFLYRLIIFLRVGSFELIEFGFWKETGVYCPVLNGRNF